MSPLIYILGVWSSLYLVTTSHINMMCQIYYIWWIGINKHSTVAVITWLSPFDGIYVDHIYIATKNQYRSRCYQNIYLPQPLPVKQQNKKWVPSAHRFMFCHSKVTATLSLLVFRRFLKEEVQLLSLLLNFTLTVLFLGLVLRTLKWKFGILKNNQMLPISPVCIFIIWSFSVDSINVW